MSSIEKIILDLIDEHFPVIHILYQGYALCQFNHMTPMFWPKGHLWVLWAEGEKVTCKKCREIFDSGPPTRRENRKPS